MTAATANRNTPWMHGEPLPQLFSLPVAAAVKCFAGTILVCDSAGNVKPAVTGTGLTVVGRCEKLADNTTGAAGDIKAEVKAGCFPFGNSAAGDAIAAADRFAECFLVDDQTVAKTSNGGARSKAGIVIDVDSAGVWVLCAPYFVSRESAGGGTTNIQSGTGTLAAGTATVTGVNLNTSTRIVATVKDPGAGAITGMAGLDIPVGTRTAGEAGSFVINAIDDAKATIGTAVCTFDWIAIG